MKRKVSAEVKATRKVVAKLGGPSVVANWCGLTAPTVCCWSRIPAEHAIAIEKESGVRCEQLRPDVDWGYLRQAHG